MKTDSELEIIGNYKVNPAASLFPMFEFEEFEKGIRPKSNPITKKPGDEPAPDKKKEEQALEKVMKLIDLYLGIDSSSSSVERLRKRLAAYFAYMKSCKQADDEFKKKS
jgi:hypothetical protein